MALESETRLAAEVLKDGRLKSFLERIPFIFDSVSEQEEADQFIRVWICFSTRMQLLVLICPR